MLASSRACPKIRNLFVHSIFTEQSVTWSLSIFNTLLLCCKYSRHKANCNKNMQPGQKPSHTRGRQKEPKREKGVALVKSQRKALTPEWEKIRKDTNVQGKGFGKIRKESTYARAGNARKKE